jgi:Ca-activated chloride channel family protein
MNLLNPFGEWGVTFANPWLLLLLLVIPALAWLKGRRGGVPAVVYSSTAALRALGDVTTSRSGAMSAGLFYLALGLLIVALARPQAGRTLRKVEASGIDIMMVIDVSSSMLTADFTIGGDRASRLDTAKKVMEDFITARPNDRIGIIAFAGRPYLVSPLTLDHDWLLQNLERVRIGLVEDRTAIGSAIAAAAARLKEREAKSKVIVLLTDGESNAGKITPETAAEAVRALGIKLHAIGAGTNGRAPVPLFDQRTNQPARDANGRIMYQMGIVQFNGEGLKRVAQIADGQFYRATDTRSLEDIYSRIDKMEKSTVEMKQYRDYRDLFPWFIGAGMGLLLVNAALGQTVWRRLP